MVLTTMMRLRDVATEPQTEMFLCTRIVEEGTWDAYGKISMRLLWRTCGSPIYAYSAPPQAIIIIIIPFDISPSQEIIPSLHHLATIILFLKETCVLDVVPVSAVWREWAMVTGRRALDTPLTPLVSHRRKNPQEAFE
jgi:hypothetical protein